MFPESGPAFLDDRFDDSGMVTPEYAIGMLAAVSVAIALLLIARSDTVRQGLADLVKQALTPPG